MKYENLKVFFADFHKGKLDKQKLAIAIHMWQRREHGAEQDLSFLRCEVEV